MEIEVYTPPKKITVPQGVKNYISLAHAAATLTALMLAVEGDKREGVHLAAIGLGLEVK